MRIMKSISAIKSQAWTLIERTDNIERKAIIRAIADIYIARIKNRSMDKDVNPLIPVMKALYMNPKFERK